MELEDILQQIGECHVLDIGNQLGQGGFGKVFAATGQDGDRVIKVLTDTGNESPKVYELLQEEGPEGIEQSERLADAFRHEGIVKYYASGNIEGTFYAIFERIHGRTLEEIGKVSVKKFERYAPQILRAVAHMHEHGYLHNDLRRPNIMVDRSGRKERVTILDYTLARPHMGGVSELAATKAGREIIAPEAQSGKNLSRQTEIWTLGNLFYQMLTGEHPFPVYFPEQKDKLQVHVANPDAYPRLERRMREKVPEKYQPLIRRALSRLPRERYASVEEMLYEIDEQPIGLGALPVALCLAGAATLGTVALTQIPVIGHVDPPQAAKVEQTTERQRPIGENACILLETEERAACNLFRDAEEALNNKEYVDAASILEDLLVTDQKPEYFGALIESYTKMVHYTAALHVLEEAQRLFPDERIPEVTRYEPIIEENVRRLGKDLEPLTEKQCHLSFIKEKYPACKELVSARELSDQDAIDAYKEIITQHPDSAHAHFEYGKLLLKQGEKTGDTYNNLDAMNEGLTHMQRAAEITENEDYISREVGTIFRMDHKDASLGFIFEYRGRVEKKCLAGRVVRLFKEAAEEDPGIDEVLVINTCRTSDETFTLDVGEMQCRNNRNDCITARPNQMYQRITSKRLIDAWTLR
jgi:tetratricopeptide (TPR) repeat protein